MTFQLNGVVPWGRSFDEYVAMFALTRDDLAKSILDCGAGPSSFNAAATSRGGRVTSADPIYAFTAEQIRQRIDETTEAIADQTRRNADEFIWERFRSVDELVAARLSAMHEFLTDYPAGLEAGRYVPAELPRLPFGDAQFDVALCSHFLFLYSDQFDAAFHVESIVELRRTSAEVRVFPLLELGSTRSRHVDAVTKELRRRGRRAEIVTVPYEFQKNGNQMLRVV